VRDRYCDCCQSAFSVVRLTHRALVGNYWFEYEADLDKGGEMLDAKLAALVESWRRK
jgi:hypothetical protein